MSPDFLDALTDIQAHGSTVVVRNPDTGETAHIPDPDFAIRRALGAQGFHVDATAEGSTLRASIIIREPPMDPAPYLLAGLAAGTARRRGRGPRLLTEYDIMHLRRIARRRRRNQIAKASRRRNRA